MDTTTLEPKNNLSAHPDVRRIVAARAHSPFGVVLKGRSWSTEEYRYGFNGKEKDDEFSVEDGSYDFGARMYDARLGRFLSIEPKYHKFPYLSPYSVSLLNPILYVDIEGENPILGQLVLLPNGEIKIKLTWTTLIENGCGNQQIVNALKRPNSNSQIFYRQSRIEFKAGMLGIIENSEAKLVVPKSGHNILGLIKDCFKLYVEYEKNEIEKLKEQDRKNYANYLNNLNHVSYMVRESYWIYDSFETAIKRGACGDIDISQHGENFKIDLANYVLLKNQGFLEDEKNNFALYAELDGLTREQYIAKLDNAYIAIQNDVQKDWDECFESEQIDEHVVSGDNVVLEAKGVIVQEMKKRDYSFEPKKE